LETLKIEFEKFSKISKKIQKNFIKNFQKKIFENFQEKFKKNFHKNFRKFSENFQKNFSKFTGSLLAAEGGALAFNGFVVAVVVDLIKELLLLFIEVGVLNFLLFAEVF